MMRKFFIPGLVVLVVLLFKDVIIVQEINQSEENYEEVINTLPSGQVNFYASNEGYELTLCEYEAVCKNTKIVTQRSIMGAHITDIRAQKLYKDNGNNLSNVLQPSPYGWRCKTYTTLFFVRWFNFSFI